MKRSQVFTALMIHTVESIDTQGVILSLQSRRTADQYLEGDQAGTPSESLLNRAQYLLSTLKEQAPLFITLTQTLSILSRSVLVVICVLSMCVGFGVHSVGEGRHFHLLSPVLLGLLIWNGLSLPFILWNTVTESQSGKDRDNTSQKQQNISTHNVWSSILVWIQKKWLQFFLKSSPHGVLQQKIISVFFSKVLALTQQQLIAEFRRCLHLMSIAFTTGVLCSIYWDGLINQYLASAESTFLNQSQLEAILSALLWPSTLFNDGSISLHDFTYDQRHKFLVSTAAPWIHKYAISLVFWIILPRLFLMLLDSITIWRMNLTIPFKLSWFEQVPTLNIGLASHTNIGKTSLARTLLKRDVGSVKDKEHITRSRSSYFLINTPQARIRLWDTPGFGTLSSQNSSLNSHPKVQLEAQLELEAIHVLETEADIILYLVPAWPSQQQVHQVYKELNLLSGLNKSILIVINRIYQPSESLHPKASHALQQDHLRQAAITLWTELLDSLSNNKSKVHIIILDAFERVLNDEHDFFQALVILCSNDKKEISQRALQAWESKHANLIEAISGHICSTIRALTSLKTSLPSKGKKYQKAGMEELNQKTEDLLRTTFDSILDCFGLKGELRKEVFAFSLEISVSNIRRSERRKWGTMLGGALSGLSTGLAADVMSGGLTLGGGLIIGTLLGAVGGIGVVEGYEFLTDSEQEISLTTQAIYTLHKQMTLFILAASKHGRAQGTFGGYTDDISLKHRESTNETIRSRCVVIVEQLENKYREQIIKTLEELRHQENIHQSNEMATLNTLVKQGITEGFKLL